MNKYISMVISMDYKMEQDGYPNAGGQDSFNSTFDNFNLI